MDLEEVRPAPRLGGRGDEHDRRSGRDRRASASSQAMRPEPAGGVVRWDARVGDDPVDERQPRHDHRVGTEGDTPGCGVGAPRGCGPSGRSACSRRSPRSPARPRQARPRRRPARAASDLDRRRPPGGRYASPRSSHSRQIRAAASAARTGYAPIAVSPDSMIASAPSKTALATSLASARVGRGEPIIDSSIWVATIDGTPRSSARRTSCFWTIGTSSYGSSTPRSPRAIITASTTSRIASKLSTAGRVSIFATIGGPSRPRASRSASTSDGAANERLRDVVGAQLVDACDVRPVLGRSAPGGQALRRNADAGTGPDRGRRARPRFGRRRRRR